jgi:hypothetical protein
MTDGRTKARLDEARARLNGTKWWTRERRAAGREFRLALLAAAYEDLDAELKAEAEAGAAPAPAARSARSEVTSLAGRLVDLGKGEPDEELNAMTLGEVADKIMDTAGVPALRAELARTEAAFEERARHAQLGAERAETAEAELRARELHHFETEQANEKLATEVYRLKGQVGAFSAARDSAKKSWQEAVDDLVQALIHTREYVGEERLPAKEGWSWYDAIKKHSPRRLDDL